MVGSSEFATSTAKKATRATARTQGKTHKPADGMLPLSMRAQMICTTIVYTVQRKSRNTEMHKQAKEPFFGLRMSTLYGCRKMRVKHIIIDIKQMPINNIVKMENKKKTEAAISPLSSVWLAWERAMPTAAVTMGTMLKRPEIAVSTQEAIT